MIRVEIADRVRPSFGDLLDRDELDLRPQPVFIVISAVIHHTDDIRNDICSKDVIRSDNEFILQTFWSDFCQAWAKSNNETSILA